MRDAPSPIPVGSVSDKQRRNRRLVQECEAGEVHLSALRGACNCGTCQERRAEQLRRRTGDARTVRDNFEEPAGVENTTGAEFRPRKSSDIPGPGEGPRDLSPRRMAGATAARGTSASYDDGFDEPREAEGVHNRVSERLSPRREPAGGGFQPLVPGPRDPKPHNVGGGVAYQGHSGNNYGDEDEGPVDESGSLNTDDEGLCQCGPCKKRRAAQVKDEAIEDGSEPGMSLDSPAKVNAFNRRRFARK